MSDPKNEGHGGDTFTFGDLSNVTGMAVGHNASASVGHSSSSPTELAQAFAQIYKTIAASSEDPAIKEDVQQKVKAIEDEAAKGEKADASKIEGWLKVVGRMAPDILEVTATTLMNPISGVATVIQKIAEKAKASIPKP